MRVIDLRSDTVTRPVPSMRKAMAYAEVGDDVFGDDSTVIKLEHYVAHLFAKEASLFVPSGTMGNQVALKAQTEPGWEIICDRDCHIINYEVAGPVLHSQLLVNMISTEYGMITADIVRKNIRPLQIHNPRTKIVALENTHNRHGGTILPMEEILKVKYVCEEFGLIFHLDGARIWNAHVATEIPLPELVAPFDSVSVCLSKGLGAPVGSMILGSADFIEKCRRIRKLFGGGMRQVGIIAAGGLYAVKHHIHRLADDHANAKYLAESLNEFDLFTVDMKRVQTNIVLVDIGDRETSESVLAKLKELNIWAVPFGVKRIRMVTHLDVSREDCEEAIERMRKVFDCTPHAGK